MKPTHCWSSVSQELTPGALSPRPETPVIQKLLSLQLTLPGWLGVASRGVSEVLCPHRAFWGAVLRLPAAPWPPGALCGRAHAEGRLLRLSEAQLPGRGPDPGSV